MNGDYSALAQAFQRQRQPRQAGGMNRPMGQMPRGVPGPGGIMDGQPSPMQRPQMGLPMAGQMQRPNMGQAPMGMGQFGGNIPRPMGGGIMGGQPQAPRPFQQPMNGPRGPLR